MPERLLAGVMLVPFVLGLSTATPSGGGGEVAFTFQDREIVESSGLVVQDGLVLTTNDSGDSGRVFAVDPADGRTVGMTRWDDEPTDVEALAPAGRGRVWVGDIGDNSASRDSVEVALVRVGRGEITGAEETYDLVYPQGPQNAETLLAHPVTGRLYVATKNVFGGTLLAAPKTLSDDGPNRLQPVGDALAIATDGAFFPDGKHLILRNYSQATVYTFPELEQVASFRLPRQDQGEGIAVVDDDTVLVSTEGQGTDVLRVRLPADARRALAPADPSSGRSSSPTPGAQPSPSGTLSREGQEVAPSDEPERPFWPWFLTGWAGLGVIVVLMWSLRRR